MTRLLSHPLVRGSALVIACLSVASCGEDPELVRKRGQQKTELAQLTNDLRIIKEKISKTPPDRSKEVTSLTEESERQKEQITKLEGEIIALQEDKARIEKEHEAYRRKFVAR